MAEAEILALIEQGLLRNAASTIDSQQDPSKTLKVLRAQLENYVGSPRRARSTAEALLREQLPSSLMASCYDIVGRVALSFGQIEAGMKAMRAAANAAAESQSPKLEARLIASHAEALLHWVAIEPAAEEIPKLRRACIVAGDSFSLIAFHKLVAEIQAKKGLAAAARQSLKTARSLISSWPNVWQQGRLAVTSSGIEIIQSDYEAALEFTHEALSCADKSGSRDIRLPALANLAHIKLAQGKLDEAREAIVAFKSMVRAGGNTEIGLRDTEMEVALAAGDLDLATELAKDVKAASSNLDGGNSYHGLWNKLTQVRLQYRLGDFDAGLAIAMEAIPRIERLADKNLLERMQLLTAEGLGRAGRGSEGVAIMTRAVNGNPDPTLELIAETCRIAGRLTATDSPAAAIDHYHRAFRIFEVIGNRTAGESVNRDVADTLPAYHAGAHSTTSLERGLEYGKRKDLHVQNDGRPAEAGMSERFATILELGSHPPLLATEILSLLEDTDSVSEARVVRTAVDGHNEVVAAYPKHISASLDTHPDAVKIHLGDLRDLQYDILAVPLPTASARATLLSVERVAQAAIAICAARQEKRDQAALWSEHTPEQELGLVCASDRILELIKTIRRVANSNLSVLITGETGTGKELFARALHVASARKERPFLPFNCAAVAKDMLDSQLFGHRRGAFTSAHEEGTGVIRAAAGGTLFLDEIGEMTLEAQPKLLRFLESGEILPLGEARPVHVDVRIVAATNADLDALVRDGRFREDLYYRLNVLPIHIPPLRERREEIPALVEHFLERVGREQQQPMLRVADETLEYLLLYRWPGNVRQLANEIRRMAALAEPGAMLQPAHLSKDIVASRRTIPVQASEMVMPLDQTLVAATEQLERAVIERALKMCDGRNDEAAKVLGLSRKGLYLKRQRLGV